MVASRKKLITNIRAIAREHLEMVGLSEATDKKPTQISGGMKQRLSMARAMAIHPAVLILNELFGALEAISKEEWLQIWIGAIMSIPFPCPRDRDQNQGRSREYYQLRNHALSLLYNRFNHDDAA